MSMRGRTSASPVCCGVLMVLAVQAWAGPPYAPVDTEWQGDPNILGVWSNPTNWTQDVPSEGLDGAIDNGGTACVDDVVQGFRSLYLGHHNFDSGTLEIASGTMPLSGNVRVGFDGDGTIRHGGGSLSCFTVQLGVEAGNGLYELSGTGELSPSAWMSVGVQGTGVFLQTGGVTTTGGLVLGAEPAGNGTCDIQRGTLSVADDVSIGSNGVGAFVQAGGVLEAGLIQLGKWAQGHGTFTLSGTGQVVADRIDVPYAGSGEFTQAGGSVQVAHVINLAPYGSETGGAYTISAGTMSAGALRVSGGAGLSPYGPATFHVIGNSPEILLGTYWQSEKGTLVSEFEAGELSPIEITGTAEVAGNWQVIDCDAAPGRYNVLTAAGGITGEFDTVSLPGPNWTYGITDGTALWVEYVPEPGSLALLALGGVAVIKRRRQ